jgi:hypothetical protein
MTISFEKENDILVYALEKIFSFARENRYIFQAQSVWWISSIIRQQQGLIDHIHNLHKRKEALSKALNPELRDVSSTPRDLQQDPRYNDTLNIHPDRIPQIEV